MMAGSNRTAGEAGKETTMSKSKKEVYPGPRPLIEVPEDFDSRVHQRLTAEDFATKATFFLHMAANLRRRAARLEERARKTESRKETAKARLLKRLARAKEAAEKAAEQLKRLGD